LPEGNLNWPKHVAKFCKRFFFVINVDVFDWIEHGIIYTYIYLFINNERVYGMLSEFYSMEY